MFFTDIFIKRQVLAIAISLAIFLIGIIAYHRLPVREYPVIDVPVITVTTNYPGANPNLMESYVSTPIQQALIGTSGVDYITTQNSQGTSTIVIWLEQDYSITKALTDVNSRVSSILWKLPKEVYNPSVVSGTMGQPIIFLNFGSQTLSNQAINDYITRNVNPQINALAGVQKIRQWGDTYAMRIWLDPHKLAAKKLTATDVTNALKNNSLQSASGKLENNNEIFNLNTNSSLRTAEEFNNLIIKKTDYDLIRIKDIGSAQLGEQNSDVTSKAAGYKSAVIIGVLVQPTANSIAVANGVLALLPEIKSKLPADISCEVLWNPTKFSSDSIDLVYTTIWLAVLFVVIVIFAFLGSVRALLTPIITIPLSLVGVCGFMLLLGYSLNTFTLLAFVLAIGLVVDDAIVVLENIHRHMHGGKAVIPAAIEATREIAAPVIAMTLVVAIVFLPIAFTQGVTGALFREFGITLTLAVVLSGFFSLVLSPMMCSRLLRVDHSPNSLGHKIDRVCNAIASVYKKALIHVFKSRGIVVCAVILILILCVTLFRAIPSELIPDQNQGVILGIGVAPTSASREYMNKYGNAMAKVFSGVKEALNYGIVIGWNGPNSVVTFLVLRDEQKGDRDESAIINSLRKPLADIPGVVAFPMNRPALASVTGLTQPVQFVLQTTGSYAELYNTMNKLVAIAKKNPSLLNIQTDLKINKPQVDLNINREVLAWLGISMSDVTSTLAMLLSEPTVGWFDMNGLSYPVIPQILNSYRQNPHDLDNIQLRTSSNNLVSINSVVVYSESAQPQSLNQFQLLRSATLSANLAQGYTLDEALHYLERAAKKVMNNSMKYDYSGTSREYVQSSGVMAMIFISVLAAIYLMLSMKFNSFIDPLIVMISVPLSITGALLAMYLCHFTMNIYTEIGLVMLVGLISKHGILIVNFANHLQEEGLSIKEAVIDAASIRLRPILMTTAAMIFGAVPLALAQGMGHETLEQIGIVIVSGLAFGSILTLFVVPTIYTLLASKVEQSD